MRGLIVAANRHGVIGKDNKIPWHYPGDLQFFKEKTDGATVVMGRNTWESLPAKVRPLPNRRNIVVSTTIQSQEGFEQMDTFAETLQLKGDVWYIGGSRIYAEAMEHCNRMLITLVPDEVEGDDLAYFPARGLPWDMIGKYPWKQINFKKHPYDKSLELIEVLR